VVIPNAGKRSMSPSLPNEVAGVPARQWFATTHWSVVLNAADSSAPGAQEALEQLCRTYWYPLYAHVRRQGHSQEDAQDLTQEFFFRFLNKAHLGRADRDRGLFRSFLLTSLKNFLRHEWEKARAEKRGGGRTFLAWEEEGAEGRYQRELTSQLAPDQLFEQRWAMTLLQNALARLQKEYAAAGKSAQFEELKPFLSTEPGEGAYAAVASRLGISTGAVAVAVHRLRQRYGELVREEVAHTVSSPAEVQEELRYLMDLMSR
jgi:RNA polymerase sigma-70 factor (ECF subfamily)